MSASSSRRMQILSHHLVPEQQHLGQSDITAEQHLQQQNHLVGAAPSILSQQACHSASAHQNMSSSNFAALGFTLSSHVLDTALGKPAAGIEVIFERQVSTGAAGQEGEPRFERLAHGVTNDDGRVSKDAWNWSASSSTSINSGGSVSCQNCAAVYRATFHTAAYFARHGQKSLYPLVQIFFQPEVDFSQSLESHANHYHIPLLLSPYGYSTYRGS